MICSRAAQGALQLLTCLSAPAPSVQGERAMMTGREKKAEGKGWGRGRGASQLCWYPSMVLIYGLMKAQLYILKYVGLLSRRSWEAISVAPGRGTVSCKLQLPLAHATVYDGIDGLPHKFVICQAWFSILFSVLRNQLNLYEYSCLLHMWRIRWGVDGVDRVDGLAGQTGWHTHSHRNTHT